MPKIPIWKTGFMLNNTNTKIYYSKGGFDDWCVWIIKNGEKHPPRDKEYFKETLQLSQKNGKDKVYKSFHEIYSNVKKRKWDKKHKTQCYTLCEKVSKEYEEDTLLLWLTYYMTMLAEEWKENAKLGKQIKHLGVYNLLYDEYSIEKTTTYMRNIKGGWKTLRDYMKERNIYEEREL